MHGRGERGRDRLADDGPAVGTDQRLGQAHADEGAGRDDPQQQDQQASPGEVVARPQQVQGSVGVAGGEHRGVAEAGEDLALGGLGVLALFGAGLDGIRDGGGELGAHVLLGLGGEGADGGADVALGQGGGHVRTPRARGRAL